MPQDREITVSIHKDPDDLAQIKVVKSGARSLDIGWLTKKEAEDLHAQLEAILYK